MLKGNDFILGRGVHGDVVKRNVGGETYAVKTIKGKKAVDRFRQEVHIMNILVSHPNVIELLDTDEESLELRLPLMQTDLHKHLNSRQMSQIEVVNFTKQLIAGLRHLHSRAIIHRDLKPANILISGDCLKIGDFGMSIAITNTTQKCNYKVVTPNYRPPEIVLHQPYSLPVDMWSAGCVVAEMLLRKPLFAAGRDDDDDDDEYDKNRMQAMFRRLGALNNLSWPGVESFQRYTDLSLSQLEYVNDNIDLRCNYLNQFVHNTLKYNPKDRLTSKQAIEVPFEEEQTPNTQSGNIAGQKRSADETDFTEQSNKCSRSSGLVTSLLPSIGAGKRSSDAPTEAVHFTFPHSEPLAIQSSGAAESAGDGQSNDKDPPLSSEVTSHAVVTKFLSDFRTQLSRARVTEKHYCETNIVLGRLVFHERVRISPPTTRVELSFHYTDECNVDFEFDQYVNIDFSPQDGVVVRLVAKVLVVQPTTIRVEAKMDSSKPKFTASTEMTFDCSVTLVFNPTSFDRQDAALQKAEERFLNGTLHAALCRMMGLEVDLPNLEGNLPDLGTLEIPYALDLNNEQRSAMRDLFWSYIGILYGFAGTGKTYFILYCILTHVVIGHFVFMGAPNNAACSDVAAALYDLKVDVTLVQARSEEILCAGDPPPYTLFSKVMDYMRQHGSTSPGTHWSRLWAHYQDLPPHDPRTHLSLRLKDKHSWHQAETEILSSSQAVCSTLISAGNSCMEGLGEARPFDAALIDETGRLCFAEAAIPLHLLKKRNSPVTFVGDPFQLGPKDWGNELPALRLSCFDWLHESPHKALKMQSRMNERLAAIASKLVSCCFSFHSCTFINRTYFVNISSVLQRRASQFSTRSNTCAL